jgi:hypothetical protein
VTKPVAAPKIRAPFFEQRQAEVDHQAKTDKTILLP